MAEKNNATCSICGEAYYTCLSCKDFMRLQPWKIYCCSSSCYQAFQAVRGYSTGIYDKEEFKSKLKNVDLSNLENYREHIKTLIKDVLTEEVVEEELIVEEPVVPVLPRKKNYKINKVETD